MPAERASEAEHSSPETTTPFLEDLVSLAAVIGAGCEPCAETMVERALRHEAVKPLVERTLTILSGVSAARCFADAVGPETTDRMKRSLRAGRNALDRLEGSAPTAAARGLPTAVSTSPDGSQWQNGRAGPWSGQP
jgi:hypothetical protein